MHGIELTNQQDYKMRDNVSIDMIRISFNLMPCVWLGNMIIMNFT